MEVSVEAQRCTARTGPIIESIILSQMWSAINQLDGHTAVTKYKRIPNLTDPNRLRLALVVTYPSCDFQSLKELESKLRVFHRWSIA